MPFPSSCNLQNSALNHSLLLPSEEALILLLQHPSSGDLLPWQFPAQNAVGVAKMLRALYPARWGRRGHLGRLQHPPGAGRTRHPVPSQPPSPVSSTSYGIKEQKNHHHHLPASDQQPHLQFWRGRGTNTPPCDCFEGKAHTRRPAHRLTKPEPGQMQRMRPHTFILGGTVSSHPWAPAMGTPTASVCSC